ncbi:MAG: asparaginase [Methylibium sp.]|uniref:asparaginase n=1 Tax=Methylibium sp. TaxID=2067992 RepID=UPI001800F9AF|nr:asparaginase [Methylibium sp.]MBA2722459.1 asparaginase [Methylibium sp.]MBA3588482.1 asparaginase [Methylibium sp.]
MTTTNPVLVEVMRGGAVESIHRGALAVLDADGTIACSLGDTTRPIFPRSAVKSLQALVLVESGAADRLRLGDEALALACASHNGEPDHTRVAADMLASVGQGADVLESGVHWPALDSAQRDLAARGERPNALHNNCSGKHAGFVCLACVMASEAGHEPRSWLGGYVSPEHSLMREVTAALAGITGADLDRAPRGTDGCSIPTYGIALRALALGFARLGTGIGLAPERAWAAQRLRTAVAAHPFMVAGTGRFDTLVMQRLGARAFVKVGAEGVYCAALPERGLGVALKIDDGSTARAAEVVMAATIEVLVALSDDERTFMRAFSETAMLNWNGLEVGGLRASAALRSALVAGAPP